MNKTTTTEARRKYPLVEGGEDHTWQSPCGALECCLGLYFLKKEMEMEN
jgi:hypothetical protein